MSGKEKVNILLVDDRPENLMALEGILAAPDYNLVKTLSGFGALELILEQDFALILLDVHMPVMDGFETARLIKQREKSRYIPIIFLTAVRGDEKFISEGYAAGAVDYIVKPFDPHILKSKVSVFVELHRKNQQLERLNRKLQETAHALEDAYNEMEAFTYSVSHDLRTPLRAMCSFSQRLLDKHSGNLDEKGRDYLARISGAAQRMAEFVDGLLTLSRATRGEIQRKPVDLSSLAQRIARDLGRTQPERNVKFTIAEGLMADGDPRLLRSVMENLLGNAWKFTAMSKQAHIEFGAVPQSDGKRAYFVRDNGVGFNMAHASKLFGVFERLHSVGQFPGTGVGLATVQRIARRHGGDAWAEGEVDRGATFYFTLG
jgi:signal transduction histidine kinase